MRKEKLCLVLAFLVFSIFSLQKELWAAPYYQGKVIRIIVGHEVGGGYDRLARLLARYLPKYIPGKPSIIVQNMPGAGTIIAANYIYSVAKPDGLTLGAIDRGLPIAQMVKGDGIRFDLRKFSWIGSAAAESTILCLRTDLPYKTVEDLRKAKEPIHLGSVGQASNDYHFPSLLQEFAGMRFKMINYVSGTSINLAVERKEVEGRAGSFNALKPMIERGVIRPLLRCRISQPGIENLPVDEDLTTNKMGKTIMALRSAPDRAGRPYVAPPAVPPEIMKTIREAFDKALRDPGLQADVTKQMMAAEYIPADECLKIVNFVLTQPEELVREFTKYIKF